jgi:hypothetical protein
MYARVWKGRVVTSTTAPPVPAPTRTREPQAPPGLSVTTRLWMWGFIPAFLIHDGEEAGYIIKHGGLTEFGMWQTTAENLSGILFELTVGWLLILFATRAARPGWTMRVYAAFVAGWTLHGVMHLVEGVAGHGYVLGSVTALPCAVVYGALTLAVVYRDGLLERRWLLLALLPGSLTALALILAAHGYGSLIG